MQPETLSIRDIGLRESVTPRASAISDSIREAMRAPDIGPDRLQQLTEWAFVIDMTLAWGRDLTATEYAEWKAKLA